MGERYQCETENFWVTYKALHTHQLYQSPSSCRHASDRLTLQLFKKKGDWAVHEEGKYVELVC